MEGRSTRTEASSSSRDGTGAMDALTGFVLKHKWLVLAGWLVVLIAAFAAVGPAGSALSQQFSILFNAASTAIKAIGEGMSATARKQ